MLRLMMYDWGLAAAFEAVQVRGVGAGTSTNIVSIGTSVTVKGFLGGSTRDIR